MRKIFLVSVLVVILLKGYSQTYDVLFIGNSYTYSNNLPVMLFDLALSNGDTVIYDSYTPGGYTFEGHSTNPTTIDKINSNNWDFVVLQEQSQRPSFPPSQVAIEVYPFAAKLDSIIKENYVCTETMFFMTWGRKYGDQVNCPMWPPVCTFLGMQARLRDSYMEMGNTLSATVSPVGVAFKNSIEADSNINLYSSDNSHPSVMGTYLIACVFYATLFQESPVGLPFISSLNQVTATFLQNIAANTVLDSLSTWNINANITKADFAYSINASTVTFTNSSTRADHYIWDFGDGNSETVADPVHTYSSPGKYVVALEASSDCGVDKKTDTVDVIATGVDHYSLSEDFLIFPNPAQEKVTIQIRKGQSFDATIELHDMKGSIIVREVNSFKEGDRYSINVSTLPPGIYIMKITGSGLELFEKIIIY